MLLQIICECKTGEHSAQLIQELVSKNLYCKDVSTKRLDFYRSIHRYLTEVKGNYKFLYRIALKLLQYFREKPNTDQVASIIFYKNSVQSASCYTNNKATTISGVRFQDMPHPVETKSLYFLTTGLIRAKCNMVRIELSILDLKKFLASL